MKIVSVFLLMALTVQYVYAQLFPGLAGEELADAIRNGFTPICITSFHHAP